ncbi:MAG TPA: HdeD family acid-resistance protein [Candidatus Angelobacter sp.]|nr:HdeD family acid-resistance protein [Candidatus Angelobacter sp.]
MNALDGGLKRASQMSLVLSIVLIFFGVLAITLPMATSIGVVIVIGWLVMFNGCAQLIHAFQSKGIGHIAWKLLVAVLYLAAGLYLISNPALGAAGLTLVLGIFFFAEGVADVIAYASTRKTGGSSWMLFDGVVTLILGFMIWNRWPISSLWVIGTLVGVSMIMTGTTRLMMTLAVRKAAASLGDGQLRARAA